ncbi:MAG TPA: ABC transporter substrate-binding protein [Chloroflexota bacterium]|nr:ABC transporter substrate-binding protein [Chloroflexota bacterium]
MHTFRTPASPLAGAMLALSLAACGGSAASSPAASAPVAASSPPVAAPSVAAKPASAAPASASVATKPSAAASAAASAQAAAGAPKVTVVYNAVATPYLPLWIGKEAGIFQKNNLNVDPQVLSGASNSMAALLSNQAQVFQAGGSDVLNAVVGGADLVIVGTMAPTYPYLFEAQADIKTVTDLKGKKIGIGSIGDTSDIATRLVLQKAGMDPDKDVSIVAVGNPQTRTTAMLSGAIQATMDSPPDTLTLEDKGMHSILDAAALKLPASNQAIAVQRSWLNANKPVLQRYVDSLVEAAAKGKADKDYAIGVMKTYLKTDDMRALNNAYDFAVNENIAVLPYPKPEQYQDAIAILSKTNPKLTGFDVTKILDDEFVASAAQRGLDKSAS